MNWLRKLKIRKIERQVDTMSIIGCEDTRQAVNDIIRMNIEAEEDG